MNLRDNYTRLFHGTEFWERHSGASHATRETRHFERLTIWKKATTTTETMWTALLCSLYLFVAAEALSCLNGFEAKINGTKEFEIRSIVQCDPEARFCVSGWNNLAKNDVLVGFTEMRVFGCEGQRVQYTADVMPSCPDAGWMKIYDHVRYCCDGEVCNLRDRDPEGLPQVLDIFGLTQDFYRYVL